MIASSIYRLIVPLVMLACIGMACNRKEELHVEYYSHPFPKQGIRYEFECVVDFDNPSDTMVRAAELSHTYGFRVPPQTDRFYVIILHTDIDGETIQRDTISQTVGYINSVIQAIPGELFTVDLLTTTTGKKYALLFNQEGINQDVDRNRFFTYDFPFTYYHGKRARNFFRAKEE